MLKHHPVVKVENYNVFNDYTAKVEFMTCMVSNTLPGKKKLTVCKMLMVSAICYHFPNQIYSLLSFLNLTFFFLSCLPLLKCLTALG